MSSRMLSTLYPPYIPPIPLSPNGEDTSSKETERHLIELLSFYAAGLSYAGGTGSEIWRCFEPRERETERPIERQIETDIQTETDAHREIDTDIDTDGKRE